MQEIDGRRTDLPLVFLFDRSSCSYKPQLAPRTFPENIRFVRECAAMSERKNFLTALFLVFFFFEISPLPLLCVSKESDPKRVLAYSPLRRTCGQAWHTIRTLKEDWQRLQQGQKAAM